MSFVFGVQVIAVIQRYFTPSCGPESMDGTHGLVTHVTKSACWCPLTTGVLNQRSTKNRDTVFFYFADAIVVPTGQNIHIIIYIMYIFYIRFRCMATLTNVCMSSIFSSKSLYDIAKKFQCLQVQVQWFSLMCRDVSYPLLATSNGNNTVSVLIMQSLDSFFHSGDLS